MALPTRILLSANADNMFDVRLVTLELLGQLLAVSNMSQAQNVTIRGTQMARNAAVVFPFPAVVFPFRELPRDATS
jgi:hypothetical protein